MVLQIVIIDDSPVNVTLLKFLVEKRPDCHPQCFTDPREALSWCQTQIPDLVVMNCSRQA
ncbi:MAG: hypothetical protein G3H99_03740 [Ferrovum sp.]|nr:hypothetical protein [Ferrovum sp.]